MYQAQAYIRDYDPATDTATIELVGIGAIDTWISGIRVHSAVSRAMLAGQIAVTVEMPDPHRICEAVIVNHYDGLQAVSQGTASQKSQTGRVQVNLGGTGVGSVAVTFPQAFAAVPTVAAQADDRAATTISAVTVTGFTLGATNASRANGAVFATWSAVGT